MDAGPSTVSLTVLSELDEPSWDDIASVVIQDQASTSARLGNSVSPPGAAISDSDSESTSEESSPEDGWQSWQQQDVLGDDVETEAEDLLAILPGGPGPEDQEVTLPSVEAAQRQLEDIRSRRDRILEISSRYQARLTPQASSATALPSEVLLPKAEKQLSWHNLKDLDLDQEAETATTAEAAALPDSRAAAYLAEAADDTSTAALPGSDALEPIATAQDPQDSAAAHAAVKPVPLAVPAVAPEVRPVFGPPARPGKQQIMELLGQLKQGLGRFSDAAAAQDTTGGNTSSTVATAMLVSTATSHETDTAATLSKQPTPCASLVGSSSMPAGEQSSPPSSLPETGPISVPKPAADAASDESAAELNLKRLALEGVHLQRPEMDTSQEVDAEKFRAGLTSDAATREELWRQFLPGSDAPVGGDHLPSPEEFYSMSR